MSKSSVSNPRRIVKLLHPEKFIGKRIPRNYDWDGYMVGDYALCDDCRRLFHCDDMHSLLYPQCPADWELQKKLHVEEPMSFCPDCLTRLECEADAIDPEWRNRDWARPFEIEVREDIRVAACEGSTAPTTKSTNSIIIDRGCDIETGRYWARVGAEYRTFWSSLIRDQWFNAKLSEAK